MSIFISHSSYDDAVVNQLVAELHSHGFQTWVDHFDIPPGKSWVDVVNTAIERSNALVLVWSKTAMASGHVEKEWQAFMHLDRPIFPIVVGDCELPALLMPVQRLDFRQEALFYQEVLKLLKALPKPEGATQTFEAIDGADSPANRNTGPLTPLTSRNVHLATLTYTAREIANSSGNPPQGDEVQVVFVEAEEVVTYKLDQPLILGRSHQASNAFPDIDLLRYDTQGAVSRQHAMIARTSEGLINVIDLRSRNGTFIGHQRLEPKTSYRLPNESILFLSMALPILIRYPGKN